MRIGSALLERMSRGVGAGSPDGRAARAGPARAASRYRVREDPDGRVLVCSEAPTLRVRIERGLSVTAAAARGAPPGTIFLDGAAQGEPFVDPQRGVYNLDHHEGCVRAFTLATCEQAMVLVRKGLDLRRRDWTIFANDVDLDALLAIWVLMNHLRLASEDPRPRAAVMPLLRLEGAIDAHGLELADLTALPDATLAEARRSMDRLLAREQALRASGGFSRIDPLEYAADRLAALDALVYPTGLFEGVAEIDELARFELSPGSVGVACRAGVGLYEVEQQLRRVHGGRLGLLVLQKGPTTYSLRQVDPALPVGLDEVYARLNLVDPASGGSLSANRWGGSAEIGGSPRRTGTALDLAQIAAVCRRVHRPSSLAGRLLRIGALALASAAALALALAAIPAARSAARVVPALAAAPALAFALGLALLSSGLLALVARRTPGLFGLRRPVGRDAWLALPLALVGAAAGGVWVPALEWPGAAAPAGRWLALLALPLLPLGAEVLFRGLVHGSLAASGRIQRAGGPWRLSWPALVCAALYAPWCAVLAALAVVQPPAPVAPGAPIWGGLAFGVAAALARERSESLFVPILLHALCLPVAWLVRSLGA